MIVASAIATLRFPEAHSLKDKRQVLRSLTRKLRDRHNVSVIEADARDLWQTAVLGIALAAPDQAEAGRRLEAVRRDIEELTGLKHVGFEPAYY